MPLASTRQAQRDVAELRASVAKTRSDRISGDDLRGRARAFVDDYFRNLRPALTSVMEGEQELGALDAHMQDLLALAQGKRARKTSFLATLKELKRVLDALELRVAAARPSTPSEPKANEMQARILDTLERICPPAAASFAQAAVDLASERLSWRGTAADLREALRELLDKLAPDDEVMKQPGFKLEPKTDGPTMKQKVRFILRARGQSSDARKGIEDAVNGIDDVVGAFVRSTYTRASGSVHVERTKKEVVSIQRLVEVAMVELLQL